MSSSWNPLCEMDFYGFECNRFQRDVCVLIEGTLRASIEYLQTEAKAQLVSIEKALKEPMDEEYEQHLVDEHVDVSATNSDQEGFLLNMALVALASRLTHALHRMARFAESFSPRRARYGDRSMSEFNRLWVEYSERFGIDFDANADRIAFVEAMREVRNQIVHDGSEANTFRPRDEIDHNSGEGGYLDMSFPEKYPDYVSGTGLGAEVRVGYEQLQKTIDASINLVGWLAQELRQKELATLGEGRTPP